MRTEAKTIDGTTHASKAGLDNTKIKSVTNSNVTVESDGDVNYKCVL